MRGDIAICLKRKVFNQCIIPTITYGAETWTLTAKMERKLQAEQHNMERNMLGITYKDKTGRQTNGLENKQRLKTSWKQLNTGNGIGQGISVEEQTTDGRQQLLYGDQWWETGTGEDSARDGEMR